MLYSSSCSNLRERYVALSRSEIGSDGDFVSFLLVQFSTCSSNTFDDLWYKAIVCELNYIARVQPQLRRNEWVKILQLCSFTSQ